METARAQSQLDVAMSTQDTQRGVVESVNMQLGDRIKDLLTLHHELNHLLTTWGGSGRGPPALPQQRSNTGQRKTIRLQAVWHV